MLVLSSSRVFVPHSTDIRLGRGEGVAKGSASREDLRMQNNSRTGLLSVHMAATSMRLGRALLHCKQKRVYLDTSAVKTKATCCRLDASKDQLKSPALESLRHVEFVYLRSKCVGLYPALLPDFLQRPSVGSLR